MDHDRQLRILRAWMPLLLIGLVVAGGAGYFASNLQRKVFESKATLVVGQALSGVNPSYDQLLASQSLAATYATVATTTPVLTRVISSLGLQDSPEQLAQRVDVLATPGTALLTITASDGTAEGSARLANSLAAELIATSPAGTGPLVTAVQAIPDDLALIKTEISDTQAQVNRLNGQATRTAADQATLAALQTRLATLQSIQATLASASSASNTLTVIQPALVPDGAVSPRPLFNALLAAVVVALAVSALAFVVEYLRGAHKPAAR